MFNFLKSDMKTHSAVKVLTNLRVIGRYVRQTLNWLLSFCSPAYAADLFIFL